MLAKSPKLLREARKNGYALGAFNAYDMESAQAITWAAGKLNSPVILQVTEKSLEFAGFDILSALLFAIAQKAKIPVIIHLDHGANYNIIEKAINSGKFTSVMFDGSKLTFDENVKKTKEIVGLAHKKGVAVEAELGEIQTSGNFS